jgi:hypothetical protein
MPHHTNCVHHQSQIDFGALDDEAGVIGKQRNSSQAVKRTAKTSIFGRTVVHAWIYSAEHRTDLSVLQTRGQWLSAAVRNEWALGVYDPDAAISNLR